MLEPGGELVDTVATGWPDDELVDVATRLRSAGAWLIAGVVISGCVGVEMSWPERTINPAGLLGTVVVFVGARKLPMDAVRGRAGISVALQIAVAVVFVTTIAQAVHATSVAAIANSLADAAAVVLVAAGCTHLSRRVGADDAARWWRLATAVACVSAAVGSVLVLVQLARGEAGRAGDRAAVPVIENGAVFAVLAVPVTAVFAALLALVLLGAITLGRRTKAIVATADARTM